MSEDWKLIREKRLEDLHQKARDIKELGKLIGELKVFLRESEGKDNNE